MFTIDLLKGKGVPPRSGVLGLCMLAATVLVPVIVIIFVVSGYYVNQAKIASLQQQIKLCDAEMARLSDAVEFKNRFEAKKTAINTHLAEINSCIEKYPQWSPIIKLLVENLPESVTLEKLQVTHESVRKKVPKEGDPSQTVEKNIPYKRLHVSLACGPSGDIDREILEFSDEMKNSAYLGPKLEDVNIAREVRKRGDSSKMYELYFVFRADI